MEMFPYLLAGSPASSDLQKGCDCQRSLHQWTHTTFCLMVGNKCAAATMGGKHKFNKQQNTFYFYFFHCLSGNNS